MIIFMRKIHDSWIIKGLLAVTALSFMSFFGVSSYWNSAANKKGVAIKVGNFPSYIKISNGEIAGEFNRQLSKISTIYGSNPENLDSIKLSLASQVVHDFMMKTIINKISEKIGINVSLETAAFIVQNMPELQDANHKFDYYKLMKLLELQKMPEETFVKEVKEDVQKKILLTPTLLTEYAPEEIIKKIYEFENQTRTAKAVLINFNNISVPAPSKEELEKTYQENISKFMIPEYREISALFITPDKIENQISITDKDAEEIFLADKNNYDTPEKRDVLQMLFENKQKADEALSLLKEGQDFIKVAEEKLKQSAEDTKLGLVSKDMLLPEISENIFSAKKGEFIGPVKSDFGWHLLKISDIRAGESTSFEKVKENIKFRLKQQKAAEKIYEISTQIDDDLGRGIGLEETAVKYNLKTIKFTINNQGATLEGKDAVSDKKINQEIAIASFSTPLGKESQMLETQNGFFVVKVNNIIDTKAKELNLVKDKVFEIYKKQKQQILAKELAESVLASSLTGTDLKTAASEKGLESITINDVNRNDKNTLSPVAIEKLFELKENQSEMAPIPNGLVVFQLKGIKNISSENKDISEISKKYKEELVQKLTNNLINDFSQRLTIKVNNESIAEAISLSNETKDNE